MSGPTPGEARQFLRVLTTALGVVAFIALVFTAVNVTLFAVRRGVPWPIAVLLDPMLALGLVIVLYAEARLAAWGVRASGWSALLRWFTGLMATLMNVWESVWPDGRIGWPTGADPASILLHAAPTVLLVLVTETVASYRRSAAPLLNPIAEPDRDDSLTSLGQQTVGCGAPQADPLTAELPAIDRTPLRDLPRRNDDPAPTPPSAREDLRHHSPTLAHSAPGTGPLARGADADPERPPVGEVWKRAVALDEQVRVATGRPASVWRLRRDLRIGPARARQLYAQLAAHDGADRSTSS
ncbi:extensin [Streptomyces sp. N35]|uniref:extensin n=1 Tax=Streptomyces sp. N35 TaxID=2795730 RepID=UPI0018F32888|nr:extensin [Streptomyces sp. N35]